MYEFIGRIIVLRYGMWSKSTKISLLRATRRLNLR